MRGKVALRMLILLFLLGFVLFWGGTLDWCQVAADTFSVT